MTGETYTKDEVLGVDPDELPQEYSFTDPLEPVEEVKEMGSRILYGMKNPDEIDLRDEEEMLVETNAMMFTMDATRIVGDVVNHYNKAGDILQGKGKKYNQRFKETVEETREIVDEINKRIDGK